VSRLFDPEAVARLAAAETADDAEGDMACTWLDGNPWTTRASAVCLLCKSPDHGAGTGLAVLEY
jgi:hypothetical protein